MKKTLFGGLLVAGGMFLFAAGAQALTVEPVLIDDLSLDPGASATRSIKLKNEGASAVKLKMMVYDVEAAADETGFPQLVDPTKQSIIGSWINQNSDSVVSLEPGETRQVPLFIVVPKDAEPGGHYAVVSWGAADTGDVKGVGASVAGAAGINIALDVKGDVIEKGDLIDFGTANGEAKYDRLPIVFKARINNGGNRHFKPVGSVTVTNMFGKKVAVIPFNDANSGGNVLPRSVRSYQSTWDGGFAFGKYTATLDVKFGKKAGGESLSTSVWVLPAGLLVLWLIIAFVVVLILILLVKNILVSMKK